MHTSTFSDVRNSLPYPCLTYNHRFFSIKALFPLLALLTSQIVLAKETLTISGVGEDNRTDVPRLWNVPFDFALKISTLDMAAPQEDWRSFEISNEELEEALPVILLSVMHRVLSPSTLIAGRLHNSPPFINICVWVQKSPMWKLRVSAVAL